MKVGIAGFGAIGGALLRYLVFNTKHSVRVYDPPKDKHDDLSQCRAVFICVPVPTQPPSGQDLSAVKDILAMCGTGPTVFMRSTVMPGTCDQLGVVSMPEFLTERDADNDMVRLPILVGNVNGSGELAAEVFPGKKIIVVPNAAAELAKYTSNCFAALKVTYFNIIRHAADSLRVDYDDVIKAANVAGFIGETHTQVPGPDGKRGFGGKCLPKDLDAFERWFALRRDTPNINLMTAVIMDNGQLRREDP